MGGEWLPLIPQETGNMMITTYIFQWSGSSLEQARESHLHVLAFLDPWLLISDGLESMHFLPQATLDSGSCGPGNSYYHQWFPQTCTSAIFVVFFGCGGGFFSFVFHFDLVWFFAGGFMLPIFCLLFKVKQWKRGSLDWEHRLLTLKLVSDLY